MNDSISIDAGWEESLDSEQATHVKGDVTGATATGEWLVNVADQVVVPMSKSEVIAALHAGRLSERSLVWRVGMHDWSPLADVPQLRLAAGPTTTPLELPRPVVVVAEPARAEPPAKPARTERPAKPTRTQPPPKPARRNTLPFGFPVVRDSATVQQPAGLAHSEPPSRPRDTHRAELAKAFVPPRPASVAAPSASPVREVEALAVYDRPAAVLTFSDSVRAEWQGTSSLVRQPSARTPAPAPAPAPIQATAVNPPFKPSSVPPSSLAPTTSEPEKELPARGAGLWGDLSVVLASDLRAVKASSKRITLVASIGSAALASLLTFWVAHSRSPHAAASLGSVAPAAQLTAASLKPELPAALSAPVAPLAPAAPLASAAPTTAARPAAVASVVPVAHAAVKPAASAPRPADHPKQVPAAVPQAAFASLDANPYDEPIPASTAKAPKANAAPDSEAAKPSAAATATATSPASATVPAKVADPGVASGLHDGPSEFHAPAGATPGF